MSTNFECMCNFTEESITKLEQKAEIISNPYPAIRVGNELANSKHFKEAEVYFNRAIEIEPKLVSAAYQGLSWCYIEDKMKSMECLEKALMSLADEKGILELCYQPEADKSENTLHAQIICTINLIGNHINSVRSDLNKIKKSQRFVDICLKNPHTGNQIEYIEVKRDKSNIEIVSSFTAYDITFHDLSVENLDVIRENDQLIRVADSLNNYKKDLVLSKANTSLLYSLTAEKIDKRGLTKKNALSVLREDRLIEKA